VPPTIILGSASPRRIAFLHQLGLDFEIHVANIDETPFENESPIALVLRLAEAKAETVVEALNSNGREEEPRLVIAADTVVAIGDQLLGKPDDEAQARRMLRLLRTRPHQVHSAICVRATRDGRNRTRLNSSTVTMRAYSDEAIDEYIATGDPMDKAGAYAIQHPGFAPVAELDGCFTGVMGLPLGDLCDLLAEFGIEVDRPVPGVCEEHTAFSCCRR
jgi:septum formation protein